MWSGSFLFSKSNGKTFSPSSATTTANQQILSPFGIPCAVPSNGMSFKCKKVENF